MSEAALARRTNRRLTARRTCQLTVRYKGNGAWRPATAMDLSRHGCRLRIGEDLERGAQLSIVFERHAEPEADLAVKLAGFVIWSRLEGLSHQAGIQFVDIPPTLDEMLRALDGA